MTFGKKLKLLRENKGYTQRELAELFQISNSALAMYETDKREPDNNTTVKIADFFGVTTDYLLGRTDDPQAAKLQAIAAHRTDDPTDKLPPEAQKSLEDFKKFLFEKHGLKFE